MLIADRKPGTFSEGINIGKEAGVEKGVGRSALQLCLNRKWQMDEMAELGLIPAAENYLDDPHSIICLCCGCCCSNVRGRTVWDNPTAVLPSHFLPMAGDDCTMCETCVDRCMLDALFIDDDEGRVMADADKCIGCGVCTLDCPEETLKLHRFERPEKPFGNRIEWFIKVAQDNDRMPR